MRAGAIVIGLLLGCWPGCGWTQPVVDLPPVPIRAAGDVRAILALPDGSWVVGGSFEWLNGVPRRNLGRLLADGSVDPVFDPRPDDEVWAITRVAGGDLIVGGRFTQMGTTTARTLVRLNSAGVPVAGFSAGSGLTGILPPLTLLHDATLDAAHVYVAGTFGAYDAIPRRCLLRISVTTGALDATYQPALVESCTRINALVRAGVSSQLIVGGQFTAMGGAARVNLARIGTTGAGTATSFNAGAINGEVTALALRGGSGRLFVGGAFSSIGGVVRHAVARLDAVAGSVDTGWSVAGESSPQALWVTAAGQLLVAGQSGSEVQGRFRRVNRYATADGAALDAGFTGMEFDAPVRVLAERASDGVLALGGAFSARGSSGIEAAFCVVDPVSVAPVFVAPAEIPGQVSRLALFGGQLYVAGDFSRVGTQRAGGLFRMDASSGVVDIGYRPIFSTATSGRYGGILALLPDPGSPGIVVGGSFSRVNFVPRAALARMLPSGALDAAFTPALTTSSGALLVNAVVADPQGRLYVGGRFEFSVRSNLARMSGAGVLDAGWDPAAANALIPRRMAIDADAGLLSLIYTGTHAIGGQTRARFARLSLTTALADPAVVNADGDLLDLTLAGDATLLSGEFFLINGQSRRFVARLDPGGGLDPGFIPPAAGPPFGAVDRVVQASDGRVYATGPHASFNHFLFRLRADGSYDPLWTPTILDTRARQSVPEAILLDPALQRLWVGGDFVTVNGQSREGLVALNIAELIHQNGFE